MTIKIKHADIMTANENIIAHQVNGLGIMGAGLAKLIKSEYPSVYESYREVCNQNTPERLLGTNLMFAPHGNPPTVHDVNNFDCRIIANLFGQARISRTVKQTNEAALEKALVRLRDYAVKHKLSVALPYGVGAGLGGGDWDDIYAIIDSVFEDYTVTLYKIK